MQVYEDMVSTTAANANLVIAEILGEQTGLDLTPSIEDFGKPQPPAVETLSRAPVYFLSDFHAEQTGGV